ncbi:MAG: 4-(cytidine 5'-diphospho)-2-C-methyl-D-erythritol kinase [Oscillospiraceae bacterium]|nr:4-(cytidine 5'-diphospho)-2-C-methyl-D-erythritol kinase [Oscillospiraceae bacterium]
MITLSERACAKINLTLDVLSKRDDGYHDLRSVMQTVSLCDDVEIDVDTGRPWKLTCDAASIPADERNLAWKAARVFFDRIGRGPDGIEIRIRKRIPSEAGLAGGSADAAAVLRALNRWAGASLSTEALCDLGALVGSDVPFCVLGGTALAEGRGERLTKLPDAPELQLVICKPPVAFATPALFKRLDSVEIREQPDTDAMRQALQDGDSVKIASLLCNVFEQAVSDRPEIEAIKAALLRHGALGASMTGSGSAVFGIFRSPEDAKSTCKALRTNGLQTFTAKTV